MGQSINPREGVFATQLDWYLNEKWSDALAVDLMIDALVKLDIASYDELVRLSGKVDALAASKPYRKLDMQALNADLRNKLNIKSNGVDALLWTYLFAGLHSVTSDNMSGEIKERGGVGVFKECLYKNASPEFCIGISHSFTDALCDIVNPEYMSIWTHHQSGGDPYCRFVFKKRTDPASVVENLGETIATVPRFDLPREQIQGLSIFTSGVFLNENTRAFLDLHGPEKTIDVLGASAYRIGQEIGTGLSRNNEHLREDLESIGKLVLALERSLSQRDVLSTMTDDEFGDEVTDCSQQQFCPEVCKQYEAFFNGVVNGINPDFEFAYEKMITKGDRTCHWVVRKRTSQTDEDAMKILAARYAKGELSEDEFEKKMANLRRHGLAR